MTSTHTAHGSLAVDTAERDRELGEAYGAAMNRAGKMLARRPMARAEVAAKLALLDHAPAVIEQVLIRLEELGLIDDAEFARTWAEHRIDRGRGRTAIIAELIAKGVERDLAEAALDEFAQREEERAIEVAHRRFRAIASKPSAEHGPRLLQALLQRGFEREIAETAVAKVLPPEGWD